LWLFPRLQIQLITFIINVQHQIMNIHKEIAEMRQSQKQLNEPLMNSSTTKTM